MTERHAKGHIRLHDREPTASNFRDEVLAGLRLPNKQLPSKFLYDERGAQLFEEISELTEYYPTRCELAIMRAHIVEIAAHMGPHALLIEYGSGSSKKTRLLLENLKSPAGYIPIDISKQALQDSAAALSREYAELEVLPVCADYSQKLALPAPKATVERCVVYYPGSTIGNFHPDEAQSFLQRIAGVCGSGGGLLIGVDLKKDPALLHDAYNDAQGVTAAFNLNLLARMNRELGSNFRADRFRHYAFYNPHRARVEMHLVSLTRQRILVDGLEIVFEAGESIWTESSYKYTIDEFKQLAAVAGLEPVQVWTDRQKLFSVQYYIVR